MTLKPCPCCASPKVTIASSVRANALVHAVECISCGIATAAMPSAEAAEATWNRRPGDALAPAPEPEAAPKASYRILCQQFVEELGEFTVYADDVDDALQQAQAASIYEACGETWTWRPGDDAQRAEIWAIVDEAGNTVWER